MIGAQRIADETTAEAEAHAEQVKAEAQQVANDALEKAQADADRITSEAQAKVDALNEQYETLRAAARAFKSDFATLIEAQTTLLRERTKLI